MFLLLQDLLCLNLDIDECMTESSVCHPNADCHNVEGSVNCTCKVGFQGNGKSCFGKNLKIFCVTTTCFHNEIRLFLILLKICFYNATAP